TCAAPCERKLAVSATHCVGGGGIGVSAACRRAADRRAKKTSTPRLRYNLKLHLGRLLASGLPLEVRLGGELASKESGHQHRGKGVAAGVESLRRFIESLAFDGDPILRTFQLRLQVAEIGGGFQIRILFADDQQTGERRGQ